MTSLYLSPYAPSSQEDAQSPQINRNIDDTQKRLNQNLDIAVDLLQKSNPFNQDLDLINKTIHPLNSQEFSLLLALPSELISYIFSFLKPRELIQVGHCSSLTNSFTENQALWKEQCQKENIVFNDPTPNWKELYKNHHLYFSENEIAALEGNEGVTVKASKGCRSGSYTYKEDITVLEFKKIFCYKNRLTREQIKGIIILFYGGRERGQDHLKMNNYDMSGDTNIYLIVPK